MGLFDVPRDDIEGPVDEFVLHELELILVPFVIKSHLTFFLMLDVFFLGQSLSVFEDRVLLKTVIVLKSISYHFELLHSIYWSVVTRESYYQVTGWVLEVDPLGALFVHVGLVLSQVAVNQKKLLFLFDLLFDYIKIFINFLLVFCFELLILKLLFFELFS